MTELGWHEEAGYMVIHHIGTWTDHDHFDMRSDVMRTYGCTQSMLDTLKRTGGHIEFTNERPPAPSWWAKLLKRWHR